MEKSTLGPMMWIYKLNYELANQVLHFKSLINISHIREKHNPLDVQTFLYEKPHRYFYLFTRALKLFCVFFLQNDLFRA